MNGKPVLIAPQKGLRLLIGSLSGGITKNSLTEKESGFYSAGFFHELLSIERKRTERSGKPILLLMLDVHLLLDEMTRKDLAKRLWHLQDKTTRSIDIKGWYKDNHCFGIIFTEIQESAIEPILNKTREHLARVFGNELCRLVSLSFARFPVKEDENSTGASLNDTRIFSIGSKQTMLQMSSSLVKRGFDIAGSLSIIVLLSPVFVMIALGIKLFSKGPVLFKQLRVGQHGMLFTFLKFRSMQVGCDSKIHQDYVATLIKNGSNNSEAGRKDTGVFKITNDPRVTPIGKILRKTSLDELPQLFNVLWGDMSLVGPRPAIPYEARNYQVWHKGRFIDSKPGITGFWQVEGRSSTSFDTMVRMDLNYIRNRSLALDLKILFRTPFAMFKGAY